MTKDSKVGSKLFAIAFLCLALNTISAGPLVTVAWRAASDPTVAGYYVYYGTNSGVYPNRIDASTNISLSINSLTPGSTYYFSTTAYNNNGVESLPALEVSFIVPGILILQADSANNVMRIQFPAAPAHYYELQYSDDLYYWSDIWTTPTENSNVWLEYDQPATNTSGGQFYRLVLH